MVGEPLALHTISSKKTNSGAELFPLRDLLLLRLFLQEDPLEKSRKTGING